MREKTGAFCSLLAHQKKREKNILCIFYRELVAVTVLKTEQHTKVVWATNKQTGHKLTCMSDSLHELEVFVVSGFQGLVAPKATSWGPICSSKQAPLILFKSSVLPP